MRLILSLLLMTACMSLGACGMFGGKKDCCGECSGKEEAEAKAGGDIEFVEVKKSSDIEFVEVEKKSDEIEFVEVKKK